MRINVAPPHTSLNFLVSISSAVWVDFIHFAHHPIWLNSTILMNMALHPPPPLLLSALNVPDIPTPEVLQPLRIDGQESARLLQKPSNVDYLGT